MINRTYFFKIESLPTLRKERRAKGQLTCVTGFTSYRSFFAKPEKIKYTLIRKMAMPEKSFYELETMLTGFNRI